MYNGAGDDDVDRTVTIDEFLEDVDAQELEADLILGGDQGKECTYLKGYVKRQAIFSNLTCSCLTCTPEGNSGVCTACSLACHDGHELWTKRDFRCDCGNSKFGVAICNLTAGKEPENSDNTYNQNFKGLNCTCCLPYPDSNAEEQVEMIQCCVCEDRFNAACVKIAYPDPNFIDNLGHVAKIEFLNGVADMRDSLDKAEGGTHWSLLVYYRKYNKFVHHDSLKFSNWDTARNLAIAGVGSLAEAELHEYAEIWNCPTPKQKNTYDSGVYVLAIAEAICDRYRDSRIDDWFE